MGEKTFLVIEYLAEFDGCDIDMRDLGDLHDALINWAIDRGWKIGGRIIISGEDEDVEA